VHNVAAAEEESNAKEPREEDKELCEVKGAELTVLGGLLCPHRLVCRPRSAVLVKRCDLTALMQVSEEKERAYRELWPLASPSTRPRLRSGLRHAQLLGFGDVCTECKTSAALPVTPAASSMEDKAAGSRSIVVRRRFSSGNVRKQGVVALPSTTAITANAVRSAVHDQLKMPVLRLWLPSTGGSADIEIKGDEVFGDGHDAVIVEKDEVAEREGTAFNNSVFLMPSSVQAPTDHETEAAPVAAELTEVEIVQEAHCVEEPDGDVEMQDGS